MSGIYFHIPFCKRICAYCDFFRSADTRSMSAVVRAMHDELDEQRNFLSDRTVRTMYFGGGTPSLLHPSELQRFVDHASELFDCSHTEEITVEANPDDVTDEYVAALRRTDVDRVSLGVQSFDDAELRFMNRRHTAAAARDAVARLQDAGIGNITVDLIFGVDGFGEDVLARSLDAALALDVRHVSAYHLTVEEGTAFHRRVLRGEMREVSEECSEREYELIHNTLCGAGFEHYEVSNYAREGFRARHNSSYWRGAQYLGVGAGAHSFDGNERRRCVQEPNDYAARRVYESESLDERDRFNEYVMTALRCVEGIDLALLRERFGEGRAASVEKRAESWIAAGDLRCEKGRLFIPARRFMISDAVIESFFDA